MRFRAAVNWAILSLWLISGAALATPAGSTANLRRIPFSLAPRAVQRDLIGQLASCGVPQRVVRSATHVDAGPIGGPGRRDYVFEATPGIGRGVGMCAGNYALQLLWMNVGNGRYKLITKTNNLIYVSPTQSLLFDADIESNCNTAGARGWSDEGRFWAWSSRAEAFHPLTQCMLLEDAQTWAKARGFEAAESY